ncbi:ATP-binding Cassette (ABC) Superfamily [Phytophthora infestans T30-4]|uniref:ATP-binding Cassette (ABC) Superfamily n=2 Tax=Phytophthora infestans TaxID=4787 RepID=D0NXT8_PHYIT|nr:ATP-binding Cassette (ABC) Superfamily [Phytophthora infestans T30-4]EEY67889.1 ATP-binding Cassette (ABC) Superfamily [Phytophthora infestans T30-4]KAF4038553.1 ABC transporter [Phytophthora infestans]|eukprot:XP_002997751.1 ATP-binding Cassette (ABC) Superfamily [Phytophthora infestans T30-4]
MLSRRVASHSLASRSLRTSTLAQNWLIAAQHPFNAARGFAAASNAGGGVPGDFVCHLRGVGMTIPGGKKLFERVSLGFLRGAKIGVLGANGSGKSTLLKIVAGVRNDFDGERWVKDGLKVGYLPQEPQLDPSKNVYENIMDGLKESQTLLAKFDEVSMAMGEPDADFDALLEEQATLQDQIETLGCWDLSHEVEKAMAALRVPAADADVEVLSGGERRRVALCRLLLEKPDMLLLDEPTNHLDAESVHWLEDFLQKYRGTVLSITHDRYFLDNVAGWVLELDRGETYAYEGNYTEWLSQRRNRFNMQRKSDAIRAKQIASEIAWSRDHQGSKKANKARLRKLQEMESSGFKASSRVEEGQIVVPSGVRLGNKVIKVKNLRKQLDDGRVLFEKLSFEIPPHAIVGIVGGNGMGKSTLFNIIAGIETPDQGSVELGKTVSLGFVSQSRDELSGRRSVYEEISGDNEFVEIGGDRINTRAYIASFNLRGGMQEKKVGSLSGGERNRVHLAKMLLGGHNVVMLDEPTNDLDVDTLRSLEAALTDFDGVSMVISHDRWFLDRICSHIIAFEGEGRVQFFDGNYTEYERERKQTNA